MKPTIDHEAVFRALKPTALDRLTDDGYSRRRDGDLARITMAAPNSSSVRRRPRVTFRLVAGAAAAACVAAGAVVVVSGGNGTGAPKPSRSAAVVLDARSVLLASAQTAEKAPATTGNFWYTRDRTTLWTSEYHTGTKAKGSAGTKVIHLSSPGSFAATEESWIGGGSHSRTIIGIDARVTLSPADETTWKALGSASLEPGLPLIPTVNTYNMPMHFQVGNKQVTMAELAGLPTNADQLEADLQRRYNADLADPRQQAELKAIHGQPASFAEFVWGAAQDLLAGPITPGTRAALYRLLAKQPQVTLVGNVTDSLGRHGVALALSGGPKGFVPGVGPAPVQERLIIDPHSAQLLAHETYALDANGHAEKLAQSVAYQAMGWTDRIDERP